MSRLKYIMELKDYYGTDLKRINHALKVLSFADRIVDGENITDEKNQEDRVYYRNFA